MAWGHLQRVLANVDIDELETLTNDLKVFMTETIEGIAAALLKRINDSSDFKNKQTGIIDPVKPLEEAKVHALSKVYCEIELYVAGLERAARQMQERGGTSVNVYGGEVGILQSGNFSSAFISPLKKALLTGFHSTAKHNATKAVSPSSETMRTI